MKPIGVCIGNFSHHDKNSERNNLWKEEFLWAPGVMVVGRHGGIAAAPGWGNRSMRLPVQFSVDQEAEDVVLEVGCVVTPEA